MTKKELRELIIQELMARPAGVVKSSIEKVNVNDIADVAQNHYDKLLDMLDDDQQNDDTLRNKLKIALAVYTQKLLDTVDSGVDPREIIQRINETFKIK
jgi:uncharacterized hydantoinase/oxoprolinase family protein